MMSTTRSMRQWAWICVGAWLLLAGCAQTSKTGKLASSADARESAAGAVDPSAPRASLVSIEDDESAVAGLVQDSESHGLFGSSPRIAGGRGQGRAAPTVFAFRHLPGWVDDGSVRAATTAGRILDVRVGRSYLARATEKSYQKAEAHARALANRLLALDDELAVLEAESKQVEDIKAFSLDKLNKDVCGKPGAAVAVPTVPGSVGVTTYAAVVNFIGKKMREIAKSRRAVQAEREKLAPEVEAAKRHLDNLRGLTQLEETNVFVTVQAANPADGKLELSYMLPGATWEAAHELRASGSDAKSVEVTSYAVVTQASGEDWDNADLTFSTQSSSAAVRIPELEALTLGDSSRPRSRASSGGRRRSGAPKQRSRGRIACGTSGCRALLKGSKFEESYKTNFEYLQVIQEQGGADLPDASAARHDFPVQGDEHDQSAGRWPLGARASRSREIQSQEGRRRCSRAVAECGPDSGDGQRQRAIALARKRGPVSGRRVPGHDRPRLRRGGRDSSPCSSAWRISSRSRACSTSGAARWFASSALRCSSPSWSRWRICPPRRCR